MKTIYLLCISVIILFSSCAKTTHFGTMPNAPMFTKSLEAQATAGAALDHLEAQGAISVLPFLGFTGNVFKGTKNRRFYEYGANLFVPLNQSKSTFIALGAGKGKGKFDGSVYTGRGISSATWYDIDSKFNTFYLQPTLYHIIKNEREGTRISIGLGFKHEEIFFEKFNVSYNSSSGMSAYTYAFFNKADNGYGVIQTSFLCFNYESKDSPIYINGQFGVRNIIKQFRTYNYNKTGSAYYTNPLNDERSLFFQRFMINITLGFRLSF